VTDDILFRTYEPPALKEGDWDESKHPRGQPGNAGQFGPGGGGKEPSTSKPGKGKAPKTGQPKPGGVGAESIEGQHPGQGYSKDARLLHDGTIYTTNVQDAVLALYEHKHVELDQPRTVSTLIRKLGQEAMRWQKAGQAAPTFNLCDVSVAGTNLFCTDTKGIPRIEMPQLDREQTKKFIKYLKKEGYESEKVKERADYLRATQDELSGAKVAANMDKLKDEEDHIGRRLVVSRDNYILDGHHHWAAKIGLDALDGKLSQATKMPVTRVDISITQLLREADKFTGGKGHKAASEMGYEPEVTRAKRPKTEIELWPEHGEDEGEFLDRCVYALTPCIGADRAEEVCGDKWDASGKLGKKGYVTRDQLSGELASNLVTEACGKTCLACDAPANDTQALFAKLWDESEHPREPAGTPEGGRFAGGGPADEGTAHVDESALRDTKEISEAVAGQLGFPQSDVIINPGTYHVQLGDREFDAAGSANLQTGKITLYPQGLTGFGTSIGGVTAHEIEHIKFQTALDKHQAEYRLAEAEPGPPPNPASEHWWEQRGGKDAVFRPDGTLWPPYDQKYPNYQAMEKAFRMHTWEDFAKSDGVSDYSYDWWKNWKDQKTFQGRPISYEQAVYETLAEIARIKYQTGLFPDHMGERIISWRGEDKPPPTKVEMVKNRAVWRELFRTVEKVYKGTA